MKKYIVLVLQVLFVRVLVFVLKYFAQLTKYQLTQVLSNSDYIDIKKINNTCKSKIS